MKGTFSSRDLLQCICLYIIDYVLHNEENLPEHIHEEC